MRTIDEVLERAKNYNGFFCLEDLLDFLPVELIGPFYKEGSDFSKRETKKLEKDVVIECMKEYMPFAIDKANNQRGISASRSIEHFINWLWLIEDKEMLDFASCEGNYSPYGIPILEAISKKYNFPWSEK